MASREVPQVIVPDDVDVRRRPDGGIEKRALNQFCGLDTVSRNSLRETFKKSSRELRDLEAIRVTPTMTIGRGVVGNPRLVKNRRARPHGHKRTTIS